MKYKRKVKEVDFKDLPQTRFKQLIDILKSDFSLVLELSLVIALFSLPLYVSLVFEYLSLSMLESITFEKVFSIFFYFSLIEIVCLSVRGIGKGAVYEVYRKRIYNEGCFIMPILFKAIKKNWYKYMLSYFIMGLSLMALKLGSLWIYFNASNVFARGFGIGVLVLYFFMRFSISNFSIHMENVYELKLLDKYKNSISFSFLSLFFNLPIFILFIVAPALLSLLGYIVLIIIIVLYAPFLEGFMALTQSIMMIRQYDKYIDKENYPDHYRLGLQKEEA